MFSWIRRRKATPRKEQICWLLKKEMKERQTVPCLQEKYLNLPQLEVIEGLQLLKKNLRKVTNFCKNRPIIRRQRERKKGDQIFKSFSVIKLNTGFLTMIL